MNEKKRVVVGLSGGVDSSVAAYRLLQEGYDVLGIYMRNWSDSVGQVKGDCPFEEDSQFAEMVARRLGIPFEIVDLSKEYREAVVDYLFREYARGRTPNPDVLCNREIKFAAFWEVAKSRGADFVATGHYCRKGVEMRDGVPVYSLLAGLDGAKDQSYFLCQVTQQQLAFALFPLGEMHKREVRELAAELKLATAERKDSYGICFVGEVDIPTFLGQRLRSRTGDIVEIPRDYAPLLPDDTLEALARPIKLQPADGEVVGRHGGAHFFTIGQRKGLGIGGKELPLFVLATDIPSNTVYVGQGHDHVLLNRTAVCLETESEHWVNPTERIAEGESMRVQIRLRYRQPLQWGTLTRLNQKLYILFEELQRGVTAGQFAVWYLDDRLVGSSPVAE